VQFYAFDMLVSDGAVLIACATGESSTLRH
jgi:hypothetical protein